MVCVATTESVAARDRLPWKAKTDRGVFVAERHVFVAARANPRWSAMVQSPPGLLPVGAIFSLGYERRF